MRQFRPCVSEPLEYNFCEQEQVYRPIRDFKSVLYKGGTCVSYKRICSECDHYNRENKEEDQLDLKHAHILLSKMGYNTTGEKSIHHQFLEKFQL